MANRDLSIKPSHLIITGVVIITFGILIPSFFINPLSTVGLSIIMGSMILLLAYAFSAVNVVRSRGKKMIKWILMPVVILLLIGGGFFAHFKYQQYLNDKIYVVNESIQFSSFTFIVTSSLYSTPHLNEPLGKIKVYGNIDSPEKCSSTKYTDSFNGRPVSSKTNMWYRGYCHMRNDSRKKIQEYISDNKRVSINYKVIAKDTVNSKDVHVEVMLDSGRDIKKKVSQFDYDPLLSTGYEVLSDYAYWPYSKSQLGGDINKGIARSQSISFDIRNSEKIIDLRITYKGQARLVRITR